ncbi:hypothetical protein J5N97_026249 [Dioscorea zingiberensis]|uniref:Uncharacterized protein n=1 Tax=Dioscorea zingiberensis TaxID=325984 RepID=A0A9D5C1X2_9LILI|nr:hypothetical protein J5N97_026249 [Dioscorea zingiberensis]
MSGDVTGLDQVLAAPPQPPWTVSLSSLPPFVSPSPRRLSSCFTARGRPVPSARRQLAWVSLQGRLIGAEEATSTRAIGGDLDREETVAWELFSPLHRVLIVAVVAVATAESTRSRKISQLQKSVDLRDQVLLGMQQKLDDLCLQMTNAADWPVNSNSKTNSENDTSFSLELPELNPQSGITPLFRNYLDKPKENCVIESAKDEMFKSTNVNNAEQEERRMSDLSDFCGSVTSSVDIQQLSTLAAEQDFFNLRRECEEKDSTIQELTAAIHASGVASSKRIMELEEIIRRKNMVIGKMKKDMLVLEQQVIQLTRLRRSSPTLLNSSNLQHPFMATNILYDMSSTSPSSSDSDSPSGCTPQGGGITEKVTHIQPSKKTTAFRKSIDRPRKQQSLSPLKENNMNQSAESSAASQPRLLGSSSGDFKRIRSRRTQPESKTPIPLRKRV